MRKTNKSEIFADEEEDKSAHEIEAMRRRAAMPQGHNCAIILNFNGTFMPSVFIS